MLCKIDKSNYGKIRHRIKVQKDVETLSGRRGRKVLSVEEMCYKEASEGGGNGCLVEQKMEQSRAVKNKLRAEEERNGMGTEQNWQ